MFLIIFAGIVGGLATAVSITPVYGVLAGLALAPFGGSALAAVAAGFSAWRSPISTDEAGTARKVADLRVSAETSGHSDTKIAADKEHEVA